MNIKSVKNVSCITLIVLFTLPATSHSKEWVYKEFTYGFADQRFGEQSKEFKDTNNQAVSSDIDSKPVGAIGFTYLSSFSDRGLVELDIRYQNTSLSGSDNYRVKYSEANNTSESVAGVSYTKMHLGGGLKLISNNSFIVAALGGLNIEYGERIIADDASSEFVQNGGAPQTINLDDDLLAGWYLKLKFIMNIKNDFYLSATPSFQKSWKSVDVPGNEVDGFRTSKNKFVPANESFDLVFGVGKTF